MTTKVTLSSPSVQHSGLIDDATNHDEPFVETHDTLSPNYTTKRPPTPPKSKQPSLPSWKQHRILKHKESNEYDCRSPEHQSTNMNKSFSSNSSSSNNSKHIKSQRYLDHSKTTTTTTTTTTTLAESNKDHLQRPPPLLQKQSPGQLNEFFMLQERIDLTHRHHDQLMEENGILRYHLHILQYRLQQMESMWYNHYYSRKKWVSSQYLQHQYRPWIHSDYLMELFPPSSPPPFRFREPTFSNYFNMDNQSVMEQPKDDNDSRIRRFRRQRSKSLPRQASFSSLQQQQMSMFRHPLPFSSRYQTSGRSGNILSRFETNSYNHPLNSNSDIDDSASEDNIVNNFDDDDLCTSDRHPRHHRYKSDDIDNSSYAPYPYQTNNTDLLMGPPPPSTDIPFGNACDFYSTNDNNDVHDGEYNDDDDGWKQRSALPRYYSNSDYLQHQQHNRFLGNPRQQQQQLYTSSQRNI